MVKLLLEQFDQQHCMYRVLFFLASQKVNSSLKMEKTSFLDYLNDMMGLKPRVLQEDEARSLCTFPVTK